ncbi:Hypothetical predicted protein [Octopus vulgaris]|uniref:Uncharacterized protein n=1 Tax=Octopus vulgaris TaxID=6645 RepID=A0AA36FBI0_OCTVU|nr:Hypothetical predicted protein [Octopus vulgaris]
MEIMRNSEEVPDNNDSTTNEISDSPKKIASQQKLLITALLLSRLIAASMFPLLEVTYPAELPGGQRCDRGRLCGRPHGRLRGRLLDRIRGHAHGRDRAHDRVRVRGGARAWFSAHICVRSRGRTHCTANPLSATKEQLRSCWSLHFEVFSDNYGGGESVQQLAESIAIFRC